MTSLRVFDDIYITCVIATRFLMKYQDPEMRRVVHFECGMSHFRMRRVIQGGEDS